MADQDYNITPQHAYDVLRKVEAACGEGSLSLVRDRPVSLDIAALNWQPFVHDPERRSFSYVLRKEDNPMISDRLLDRWFDQLHPSTRQCSMNKGGWTDAAYDGVELLRKTAWCTLEPECACHYAYADTHQAQVTDPQMISTIQEISEYVSALCGSEVRGDPSMDKKNSARCFNCVNLNFYPTGAGIGFHADDEDLFDGLGRDATIVSLSLAERRGEEGLGARTFQVRLKRGLRAQDDASGPDKEGQQRPTEQDDGDIRSIQLRHGDLLTMEGLHQLFYLHSIWPGDCANLAVPSNECACESGFCVGERINLTWRSIVNHTAGCPLACP